MYQDQRSENGSWVEWDFIQEGNDNLGGVEKYREELNNEHNEKQMRVIIQ